LKNILVYFTDDKYFNNILFFIFFYISMYRYYILWRCKSTRY